MLDFLSPREHGGKLVQVQVQEEGGSVQARKRVLTRQQIYWHLDLRFPRLQSVRNNFLLL